MSNSTSEKGKIDHTYTLLLLFIYKVPKNNHDAIVQLNSRVIDSFKKYGILRFEVFHLNNTDDMMEFINIAKTIQAKQDEEIWLEIQSYRDRKHLEEVGARMMTDKAMEAEGKKFLELITPGSRCSFGEFSRIPNIGFGG